MSAAFRLPEQVAAWAIAGVRVPACLIDAAGIAPDHEGLAAVDLTISGDRIAGIAPAGSTPLGNDLPVLNRPGMAVPCFVDCHTHLDKGHIWPRAPNPDGSFTSARELVPIDRQAHWTAADVLARMEFALQAAYAYGTRAIRTHLDNGSTQTRISWPVFAAVRDAWRDRIELQASPLFGIEMALDDAHMADVSDMVGQFGRCLGAVTYPVPELRAGLERLFRLASDNGYDLDFHADETHDPAANSLAMIAETALAFGFRGRVLVGHCCSLAMMAPDDAKRTIDVVARAGLSVVSLPMCNMYLQARNGGPGATPRWRGVTLLKELRAAGVPVMVASDNTRDTFYAHGDLDMLEVWREATRIAHLDQPYGSWAETVVAAPAQALGLATPGRLRVGDPADLVILPARSLSEVMARPYADRIVVRNGRPIDAVPAAYSELDHLEGLTP